MTTNIMLVEDHAAFRQAVALILDREPGFRVAAQAGSLAEARRLLSNDIDLAVVDLKLPDGSGTELIEKLREVNPECITLVLSASIDLKETDRAMKSGAVEVLHKSEVVPEIVGTVRRLKAFYS